MSLFVKEKLYIGEATVATIAGLIIGPHCLNWFNPLSWGNSESITLEISRIVLCVQIVAVAVELPRKYMKKHWFSVAIFLLPVMTAGWLFVGLFVWVLIPHFTFPEALLVSACVTATDPVLAAAVVGKGKFAERVPGHLRNLLSAESACNDGMAFPFIFLSLNLLIHPGNAGEIVKDWILVTILYECVFGLLLGIVIGFVLKRLVAFAEKKNLIDRESFLAFFVFLAFNSAGLGSILGVDDLLVSFSAGTTFGWNGDFARKTEESHVSTVIDLIINLAFFVYFGAIIPWQAFNDSLIGLDVWRLIILALVIIFLRRIPAVVALKPITPDLKLWREAFFCGHFGPIGVGAIFAVILARRDLEEHYHIQSIGVDEEISSQYKHFHLLNSIWPLVNFIVITSIVVHGSSVAVTTLGQRLNRMAITMTFTAQNESSGNWLNRLQKLERASTSFSLHRVDSGATTLKDSENGVINLPKADTIETSGIKYRPAGGAKRKSKKKKKKSKIMRTISRSRTFEKNYDDEESKRQRPASEFLQLGGPLHPSAQEIPTIETPDDFEAESKKSSSSSSEQVAYSQAVTAYQEGSKIILEDKNGEIIQTLPLKTEEPPSSPPPRRRPQNQQDIDNLSIHSMESLQRHLTEYSSASGSLDSTEKISMPKIDKVLSGSSKKAYYKKDDPRQAKVYAHQIDDVILIENEEGDIIRRYKVNRHQNQRRRNASVVDKALSFVGIKTKASVPENDDLEKNSTILTPQFDAGSSELRDSKAEQRLELQITQNLVGKGHNMTEMNVPIIKEHFAGDDNIDDDDEEEEEDDDDENGEYNSDASEDSELSVDSALHEETEVERARRLAALGHTTANRDEDDEED